MWGLRLRRAGRVRWSRKTVYLPPGVGFEYSFLPNWTARIEYDHLWMSDSNNNFSVVNPLFAGAANRISRDVDMVTLCFNYCFGWGNPVVAHY